MMTSPIDVSSCRSDAEQHQYSEVVDECENEGWHFAGAPLPSQEFSMVLPVCPATAGDSHCSTGHLEGSAGLSRAAQMQQDLLRSLFLWIAWVVTHRGSPPPLPNGTGGCFVISYVERFANFDYQHTCVYINRTWCKHHDSLLSS